MSAQEDAENNCNIYSRSINHFTCKMLGLALVAVGGGCRAPLNNYCQCLLISLVRLAQLLALGGNHPYFGKQLNELQSPGRLFITQPKM